MSQGCLPLRTTSLGQAVFLGRMAITLPLPMPLLYKTFWMSGSPKSSLSTLMTLQQPEEQSLEMLLERQEQLNGDLKEAMSYLVIRYTCYKMCGLQACVQVGFFLASPVRSVLLAAFTVKGQLSSFQHNFDKYRCEIPVRIYF